MIWIMVVMEMSYSHLVSVVLVLWAVSPIPRNG